MAARGTTEVTVIELASATIGKQSVNPSTAGSAFPMKVFVGRRGCGAGMEIGCGYYIG